MPPIQKQADSSESEFETGQFLGSSHEPRGGTSMSPPPFQLNASQSTNQPFQLQEDGGWYEVKAGDSPISIATKLGVPLESLLRENGYRLSSDPEEQAQGILIHIDSGDKKILDAGDRLNIPNQSNPSNEESDLEKAGTGAIAGSSFLKSGIAAPTTVPTGFAPNPNMTASRHVVSKSNFMPKTAGNSLLLESITQENLLKLYREAGSKGILDGEVALSNGQKWYIRAKDGKFHPVSGKGIINLSNAEMNAMAGFRKAAINKGPEAAISALKSQLQGRGLKISPDMQAALEIVAKKHKIPTDKLLKAVGGLLDDTANANKTLLNKAEGISRGRSFKVVKWGGRILLVVAVAADIYELYEADFAAKEVAKKTGAWGGSLAAGAVAGEAASPLLATGPWGWLAYGVIVVGAGAGGYFLGEAAAETIYEWGWEEK